MSIGSIYIKCNFDHLLIYSLALHHPFHSTWKVSVRLLLIHIDLHPDNEWPNQGHNDLLLVCKWLSTWSIYVKWNFGTLPPTTYWSVGCVLGPQRFWWNHCPSPWQTFPQTFHDPNKYPMTFYWFVTECQLVLYISNAILIIYSYTAWPYIILSIAHKGLSETAVHPHRPSSRQWMTQPRT